MTGINRHESIITRRDFLKISATALLVTSGCKGIVEKIIGYGPIPTDQVAAYPIIVTPTIPPAITAEPTAGVDIYQQLRFDELLRPPLLLDGWYVAQGSPIFKAEGRLMTLSGTDVQSSHVYNYGVLEGVIHSSDWKPQTLFSDSSFGFETWNGTNNDCHYGVLFKSNGHLAVLSSTPDMQKKCSGDPKNQAYPPVPNWDAIRAGKTVSFTLIWNTESVTLRVKGNGLEEQVSYTGPAIPTVPLHVRLYSQTSESHELQDFSLYGKKAVYNE